MAAPAPPASALASQSLNLVCTYGHAARLRVTGREFRGSPLIQGQWANLHFSRARSDFLMLSMRNSIARSRRVGFWPDAFCTCNPRPGGAPMASPRYSMLWETSCAPHCFDHSWGCRSPSTTADKISKQTYRQHTDVVGDSHNRRAAHTFGRTADSRRKNPRC